MKRGKSLVMQEKVLTGLQQDFTGLRFYRFHDKSNRMDARDLMEAALHAMHNKEIEQAKRQVSALSNLVSYDKSLNSVSLLKTRYPDAKIFCFHESPVKNRISKFMVKSRDLDWQVKPLAESEKRIPVEVMRNLTYLKQNGIKADSIAIGVAVKHDSIKDIARDEAGKIITGIAKMIDTTGEFLSDPVLLVRFGPFYVEAGRWV